MGHDETICLHSISTLKPDDDDYMLSALLGGKHAQDVQAEAVFLQGDNAEVQGGERHHEEERSRNAERAGGPTRRGKRNK